MMGVADMRAFDDAVRKEMKNHQLKVGDKLRIARTFSRSYGDLSILHELSVTFKKGQIWRITKIDQFSIWMTRGNVTFKFFRKELKALAKPVEKDENSNG